MKLVVVYILPFFDGGWWSVMVREDGFDTNVEYLATED